MAFVRQTQMGAGADEVRAYRQPQDRQGARSRRAALTAWTRRQGDRIEMPFAAAHESVHGRYCCKSRKSNNPKNLAKVDLWISLLLRRFSTPLRRSVIDCGSIDMVPHSAARKTPTVSNNSRSSPQKNFCNKICTFRTCAAWLTMSVNGGKAGLALGRIGAFLFASRPPHPR